MDSFINTARISGHNTNIGKGVWSVSARAPKRPYMPMLKDIYPRNEYTMMHQEKGAPKYYNGHFLKYDYKDIVQQQTLDESRPVVFKTKNIESVQSKKKFGQNMKGQSSIPLHLCNDMSSLLYQRCLQPKTMKRAQIKSEVFSESAKLQSTTTCNREYTPLRQKNTDVNTMYQLQRNSATQQWTIPNTFQSKRNVSPMENAVRRFDIIDNNIQMNDSPVGAARIQSAPEWYSEFFPREKVATALKFMGQSKSVIDRTSANNKFD